MTSWPAADRSSADRWTETSQRPDESTTDGSTRTESVTLMLVQDGTCIAEPEQETASTGASKGSVPDTVNSQTGAAPTSMATVTELRPSAAPSVDTSLMCPVCGEPRVKVPAKKGNGKRNGSRLGATCGRDECKKARVAYGRTLARENRKRRMIEAHLAAERECHVCHATKPLNSENFRVHGKTELPSGGHVLLYRYWCIPCDIEMKRVERERLTEAERERIREVNRLKRRAKRDKAGLKHEARQSRAAYARRKNDPAFIESRRKWQRERLEKIKQDPVAYQKYLEDRRIEYRLRRERQGFTVSTRNTNRTTHATPKVSRDTVSSRQIVAAVQTELATRNAGNVHDSLEGNAPVMVSLEHLFDSFGVSVRAYSRWKSGGRARIGEAEKVLLGLGREWWEVWPPVPERQGHGRPLDVLRYIDDLHDHNVAKELFPDV